MSDDCPEVRAGIEATIQQYLDTHANALICTSRKNMARQIADLVIAYHWPRHDVPTPTYDNGFWPNDDDRRMR